MSFNKLFQEASVNLYLDMRAPLTLLIIVALTTLFSGCTGVSPNDQTTITASPISDNAGTKDPVTGKWEYVDCSTGLTWHYTFYENSTYIAQGFYEDGDSYRNQSGTWERSGVNRYNHTVLLYNDINTRPETYNMSLSDDVLDIAGTIKLRKINGT